MALPYLTQLPASQRAGFATSVKAMAARLRIRAEWAMVVMMRESELKPTARNKNSGATGLIQFVPKTARALGTSVDALARMSATQQLKWVEIYWRDRIADARQTPQTVYDLYFLTLHPTSMGKPATATVFPADSLAYKQNASLDKARKGYVTVADVQRFVDGSDGVTTSQAETAGLSLGALALAGGLVYLTYHYGLSQKTTN